MSSTHWDDLIRVPGFLQQCILSYGLKEMRLLNKATSKGTVSLVEGCEATITGTDDQEEIDMFVMLRATRLARFRVVLRPG